MVQYGSIDFEYSDEKGDSIWALYAQRIKGKTVGKEERKVAWLPFAVPQERKNSPI